MQPAEETTRHLTPLHLVAAESWPEAIRLLLAGGADRYAQDSLLELPIDLALRSNCSEAVELLLDGDCIPQFTTPRKDQRTTIPWDMLEQIVYGDERIRDALLHTLIRLRPFLGDLRPYHDLLRHLHTYDYSIELKLVPIFEVLILGGYDSLEMPDSSGATPLMLACQENKLGIADLFIKHKVSLSTPHRVTSLTAGYYLDVASGPAEISSNRELLSKVVQSAFDDSSAVNSHCLCSPEGYTPLTSSRQYTMRGTHNKKDLFDAYMSCLRSQTNAVEQQSRAFALLEVFDRLGMTHTCIDLYEPGKQISEEDRLEIQFEEEEFNDQLQELMEEYDLGRAEFKGGPVDFLELFLDSHEVDLPSKFEHWEWNWNDSDVLGPGENYQSIRYSFAGNEIVSKHREQVTEENMLALLFGDNITH